MHKISIKLKSLKVVKFNVREGTAEIAAVFNDRNDKEIFMLFRSDQAAEQQVSELLSQIVGIVRGTQRRFEHGSITDAPVSIMFDDKETMKERAVLFIAEVFSKIRQLKNAKKAEGYMSMITLIQGMKIAL